MSEYYHFCEHIHNQVGRRIMEIRIIRGLSRADVIERSFVDIPLAVLEKTETKEYCLSAAQLSNIARILDVPTRQFFQPLGEEFALSSGKSF